MIDPYPVPFKWSDNYLFETMNWANPFTEHEQTMSELLNYPNPAGLHPDIIRWRDLARKLKQQARELCGCESGFYPLIDGSAIECPTCAMK